MLGFDTQATVAFFWWALGTQVLVGNQDLFRRVLLGALELLQAADQR